METGGMHNPPFKPTFFYICRWFNSTSRQYNSTNGMISTLILDDRTEDVAELSEMLKADARFRVVGEYTDPLSASRSNDLSKVDLIFTDIEMPGIDGLSYLRTLQTKPHVVVISAFPKYALSSFEFEPVHFLVKPLEPEGILTAMERAFRRITAPGIPQALDFIFVRTDQGRFDRVPYSDLKYVTGDKEYQRLFLVGKQNPLHTYKRLKQLLEELPGDRFIQVHKSHIVNVTHISSVSRHQLVMSDGKSLPVGETYRPGIERLLPL